MTPSRDDAAARRATTRTRSLNYEPCNIVNRLGLTNTLPEGWKRKPLRAVASCVVSNVDKVSDDGEIPVQLCNYTDVYHNEFISPRLGLMRATASEAEIERFALSVDDVVITKDSETWDDIGVAALVIDTSADLICGYHLALLRPHTNVIHGAFLFRCLQAKPIQVQLALSANGVTRFGLPKSEIGAVVVPVPPLSQQRAIARYLDCETARLDAMVVEKERLLDLLAEKRQALISHAVTRGLDPAAPVGGSGTPWLGDSPDHWTRCHLKRALDSLDYGVSAPVNTAGNIAVLRMGDIRDGSLDYSAVGFVDDVDDALLLQPGDLLYNRTNSLDQIGKVALFRGNSDYPVSFASYLVRFRCDSCVLPEFLNWLLNSTSTVAWVRAEALPAIGQVNLNPNRFGYLPVALPPLIEQEHIVSFLESEIRELDAVRSAAVCTIALLKERRSALIAAAVTGQVEVGGTA